MRGQVAELEAELGKDPSNALLQELLVNTYQDEMRVLTAVHDGPHLEPLGRFDPRPAAGLFRNVRTRLAAFGDLGHMWELYAMWSWAGVFAAASLAASTPAFAMRRPHATGEYCCSTSRSASGLSSSMN